jgi:hypothetical protein
MILSQLMKCYPFVGREYLRRVKLQWLSSKHAMCCTEHVVSNWWWTSILNLKGSSFVNKVTLLCLISITLLNLLTLKTLLCGGANGWRCDTERNTCAASYVTADNSRPMAYLILKVICKWNNKDWYTQKWYLFTYKVNFFQYKSHFNTVFNVNPGKQTSPKIVLKMRWCAELYIIYCI